MRLDLLLEAINEKREEMIKIGLEKGLQCEETVHCSRELDKLLNFYQYQLLEDAYRKPSGEQNPVPHSFLFLHGVSPCMFFV